jgi:GNAT superfamily N-acetyltransferase
MVYRIREVDGYDEEVADTLRHLHDACFAESAPQPDLEVGHWWLVYDKDQGTKFTVAFAGLVPAEVTPNTGYFNRVGVLHVARGHKLQKRLLTVVERRARKNGWTSIISDTTDNPPSANAMISGGYKIFEPEYRWAFNHSIYWKKDL